MKRVSVAFLILILLGGCTIRIAEVPPRVYSLESAMQVLRGKYTLIELETVSSYEDIELKGMVAVYVDADETMYLMYGFKDFEVALRNVWKSIVRKYGIWNLGVYIDLPTVGYYSTSKRGKYIVAWWKDLWLFVVEANKNPKHFVGDIMDAFAKLGGMLR